MAKFKYIKQTEEFKLEKLNSQLTFLSHRSKREGER